MMETNVVETNVKLNIKILNNDHNEIIQVSPTTILEKKIYDSFTNIKRGKTKVSQDDFKVLNYKDYCNVIKYNYNVKQLKSICKHYKIKKSGNKDELVFRIYNFLYYSLFAIKIQSVFKGFLQRKLNKHRGPGFLNYDKCVNDSDFCTLEDLTEVEHNQFFSFKSNNLIYGFDICSLYNYIKNHQKDMKTKELPCNPYDRQPLPEDLLDNMKEYIRMSKIFKIKLNVIIKNEIKTYSIEEQNKHNCIRLFQKINELGNYSDSNWFSSLVKNDLIQFLKELYDIWNYRASLSAEVKLNISTPVGNPFRGTSFLNFIILQQQSLEEVRKIALQIIENTVNTGINDEFKALGAYYVLGALTLVNDNAAIALPWLYQSVVV